MNNYWYGDYGYESGYESYGRNSAQVSLIKSKITNDISKALCCDNRVIKIKDSEIEKIAYATTNKVQISGYSQKKFIANYLISDDQLLLEDIKELPLTEEDKELLEMEKGLTGSWTDNEHLINMQEKRLTFLARAITGDIAIQTVITSAEQTGCFNRDKKIITIGDPPIPCTYGLDSLTDWRLKKATNFHEIGHALFSPAMAKEVMEFRIELTKKGFAFNANLFREIYNILEDRRIEAKMMAKIPAIIPLLNFKYGQVDAYTIQERADYGTNWWKGGQTAKIKEVENLMEAFWVSIYPLKTKIPIKRKLKPIINKALAVIEKPFVEQTDRECVNYAKEIYKIMNPYIKKNDEQMPEWLAKLIELIQEIENSIEKKLSYRNGGDAGCDIKAAMKNVKGDTFQKVKKTADGFEEENAIDGTISVTTQRPSESGDYKIPDESKAIRDAGEIASQIKRVLQFKRKVIKNKWTGSPNMRKIRKQIAQGGITDWKIMQKEKRDETKISVCVLCDLSGSMNNNYKLPPAKQAVATIGKAMDLLGANYSIRGFTSYHGEVTDWLVKDFKENEIKFSTINKLNAGSNNRDGTSIRVATHELLKQNGKKYLFVISDGEPSDGNGYSGEPAKQDTINAIAEAENQNVRVIGIGIAGSTKFIQRAYPTSFAFTHTGDFAKSVIDVVMKTAYL